MTGFKSYLDKLLQRPLDWLLHKKICYWQQRSQHFAKLDKAWIFQPAKKKSGIVILAREHYQEFVRSYPITAVSELQAVLKQEFITQSLVFHSIADVDNNRRQVCTFVVNPALLDDLADCWLVIPETWLLWLSGQKQQMLYISSPTQYYSYSGESVPISQRVSLLCQSAEAFKVVQGIPAQTTVLELSQNALADQLAHAMSLAVVHRGLMNFFRFPSAKGETFAIKQGIIITAVVSFLYLLGSSLYLTQHISSTEQKLKLLSSEVGDLLTAQQQYEHIAEDYRQYFTQRTARQLSGHIWLVLAQAQQQDPALEIGSLVKDGENLIVRGQTDRATDLLALLKSNSMVGSAGFVAPVLNTQGKESFVVSIRLEQVNNQQGAVDGSQ
jgi:hypothetical protein